MKRSILFLTVFGFCVSALSVLAAQISVDVSLVTLVATVTDSNGRHVPGLGISDFVVTEDGKEQKITLVEQSDDLPVSMGVVLDTSNSMQPKIQTAATAIDRFLRSLHPEDDVFLMTFAAQTRLEQNFTTDRDKITSALRRVRLGNETALYDATEQGIQKVRDGRHQKKAVLLVTDGQDTASTATLDRAMLDIRQSELLLYCLGIGPGSAYRIPTPTTGPTTIPQPRGRGSNGGINSPSITLPGGIQIPLPGPSRRQFPGGNTGPTISGQDSVDMNVLNSLANASGGKAWLITDRSVNGSTMDDALDEISTELRSQYTIAYHPEHPMNDKKWHQVVVRTRNNRYEVRSRKEYYGGENSAR